MGRFVIFEVDDGPSSSFGVGLLVTIVIVALLLLYEGVRYIDSHTMSVHFQMQAPAEVNGEDIAVRTVYMKDNGKIKTKLKELDEDGNGKLMIGSKPHQLYAEYDGICYYLTTLQVEGTEEYLSACTYEGLVDAASRPVLVQIRDVDGQTVSGQPLQVTFGDGDAQTGYCMGEDGYAVILRNDVTGPVELTFRLEGYEPLAVSLDVQQRVTMVQLTMQPE